MRRITLVTLLPVAAMLAMMSLSAPASAAGVCSSSTPQYCPAPVASTGTASGLTTSKATLNGTVNPNGAATACVFGYGKSATYGSASTVVTLPAGTSSVSVSVPVTGLTPKTMYHFELACRNAGGSGLGGDKTLTTLSAVAPKPAKSKIAIGKRKETVSKKGVAKFSLSCRSSTTCRGKLSLSSTKGKSLGKTVKYTIRGHKSKTISVKLSKKALKTLTNATHKREKARAKAVDSDKSSTSRTVTLIFSRR